MNKSDYDDLLELARQRPLTPAEQARLKACFSAHPDAASDWDEELALTQLLRQLPDVPLASNFTTRVMEAVQAEAIPARPSVTGWWPRFVWASWSRQAAMAGLVLGVTWFSIQQYQASTRAKLAESVSAVSGVADVPQEVWQDFDAILRLGQTPPAVDLDLLSALQ